ncbi:MAG TPA: PD-(D/E)XK nuclease family protein [Terriglobia bacterium]|nr:PD-(D/E)XK nuclease family protein [Terriglobia bacterium]
MHSVVTALSTQTRLDSAAAFVEQHSGEEILLISHTRTAADEFVRSICKKTGGVFGVHRFTLPQLAFDLATEPLAEAGKTFIAGVALEAMAARAIHACRTAGTLNWFDTVATTPGFFRALASTIAELRLNEIEIGVLRRAGPAGLDLAGILKQFATSLEEASVADLAVAYREAMAVVAGQSFRYRGRPLVLLDLVPTTFLEQQMLRALGAAASSALATVHSRDVASLDCLKDALSAIPQTLSSVESRHALDRLRANVFESTSPTGDLDSSITFLSATDEGRECAEIARSILELARSGVRFDQMAIVLRNPGVYQPSIQDALRRAEIPAYFSLGSRRPNPAGRAFLALLACAAEGLTASRFSEYLSLGQVPKVDETGKPSPEPAGWSPPQGELFPASTAASDDSETDDAHGDEPPVIAGSLQTPYQWERLLVDAAVVGGRDRWVRRLDGLQKELVRQIAEAETEEESTQYLERQLGRLASLRHFAIPLIDFLEQLPDNASWDEWLDQLEQLATLSLRNPEPVLSVLNELRPMGSLGPAGLDEIREVLAHRLSFLRVDTIERRYGKVFVTSTAEVAGLSFDVVFVPGLAEGTFPKKAFEDPLLLDDSRQLISPWLATQNVRTSRERLLLHMAAASARSRLWISYPRMDLGQGRSRSPSFYALDILRAITGTVPTLTELQRRSTAHTQSQVGWPAPRDANAAIDDAEFDLAIISGLLRQTREQAKGRARYLLTANSSLGRSLRARAGRWRRPWTEGDGIVTTHPALLEVLSRHRLTARPYSATALQQFAACPYRFVLYSIHRIQPRAEANALERIDPLTRGSLLHAAQFRILTELRDLKLLPVTPDNLSSVLTLADRVFDEVVNDYHEELAPAIPKIWEQQTEGLRWDVRGWLREMAQASHENWTPKWFELSFGLRKQQPGDPASQSDPITLIGDIRVRGAIDMVEEKAGRIRITDHKTGKAPTQGPGYTGKGEVLQPVLYALAAEILLGEPAESGRLSFCTERGGYKNFDVPIDDISRQALANVVTLIDRSIADGFLPAAPREGACAYCDYRSVCGPYEESRIHRKAKDRLALLEQLRDLP